MLCWLRTKEGSHRQGQRGSGIQAAQHSAHSRPVHVSGEQEFGLTFQSRALPRHDLHPHPQTGLLWGWDSWLSAVSGLGWLILWLVCPGLPALLQSQLKGTNSKYKPWVPPLNLQLSHCILGFPSSPALQWYLPIFLISRATEHGDLASVRVSRSGISIGRNRGQECPSKYKDINTGEHCFSNFITPQCHLDS